MEVGGIVGHRERGWWEGGKAKDRWTVVSGGEMNPILMVYVQVRWNTTMRMVFTSMHNCFQ